MTPYTRRIPLTDTPTFGGYTEMLAEIVEAIVVGRPATLTMNFYAVPASGGGTTRHA